MCLRLNTVLFLTLLSFTVSAYSVSEENGYYLIEHTWRCEEDPYSISFRISKDLYDYYQNDREHIVYQYKMNETKVPPCYSSFILSEHNRPIMQGIVKQFEDMASSKFNQVQLAVSFVQSIPYTYDSVSKGKEEYLRYPVETLVDGSGDCEDKTALLAAILYEMRTDFILLVLSDHMAVGIHDEHVDAERYLLFQDKKYYYVETTDPGWQIGRIPKDYHYAEIEPVIIEDTPSLLVKGVRLESQPTLVFEKALFELELDLHNLGPGKVTNLQVHVRLVTKERKERLLAEEHFSLNDMQEGELHTEKLSFKSYVRENCALQIELTGDEIAPNCLSLQKINQ